MRVSAFFVGSLFSVGAAALLLRHLGVVEVGRYTTAMSLSAVVAGLTDLGLTAIGIRELAVLHGEPVAPAWLPICSASDWCLRPRAWQ